MPFPTSFPGALDNFTDGIDIYHADVINAIEKMLTGPIFFNVKAYGAKCDGTAGNAALGTDDTAAWVLAIAAASPVKGVVVWTGVSVVTGLSLSGKACTIMGIGDGSVLQAKSGISIPVLDLTSYAYPGNAVGPREFGNFMIVGDNTAGTAKKGFVGGPLVANCVAGMAFKNISVMNTGGIGWDSGGAQLCNFTNIVVQQPVSAQTNNVPYFRGIGAHNGNRYIGCGMRNITGIGSPEGANGAFVLEQDGSFFTPQGNALIGCWTENMYVPANGSLFHFTGNYNLIDNPGNQFFDGGRVSAAASTTFILFSPPAGGNDFGGNEVRGFIPGNAGGGATAIAAGVTMAQAKNRVVGVKGNNGNNLVINSGIGLTFAEFGGADGGSAATAACTDNSGLINNVVIDGTKSFLALPVGAMVMPRYHLNTAYAATVTPDANLQETIAITLTGAITVNNAVNTRLGQRLRFIWTQDGTGGRVVTYTAGGLGGFRVVGAAAFVTTLNTITVDEFIFDGSFFRLTSRQTGQN